MQMIMNFLLGTTKLMLAIMVVGALTKIFLKRTLVGRLISVILKDIYLSLKLAFRISRHTIKIIHRDAKRLNNYMYKHYKRFEGRKQEKKVVNGNNNIIDFKKAIKKT